MRRKLGLWIVAAGGIPLAVSLGACSGGGGGGGGDEASPSASDGTTQQGDDGGGQATGGGGASGGGSATGWSAVYGGTGSEEMEAVIGTPGGGFVVCGITSSFTEEEDGDALLVKLNSEGSVAWAKTYGGPGEDMAIDVKNTPDGGFVVAGWTQSFGVAQTDAWVLKLDASGAVEWAKAYGGAGKEQAWSVDLTKDGGYVITGGSTSFGAGGADYWVVKLNADGSVAWQKAYGGPEDDAPGDPYDEYVARIVVDSDGNLVVGSLSYSFGTNGDVWLLKLSPDDGSILWQYAYGGPEEDSTWSFSQATDGGYVFSGSFTDTEADLWVVRLDSDGGVVWEKRFGIEGRFDEALNETPTSDGGLLVSGYYERSSEDWGATLVKVSGTGGLEWAREYHPGAMDWTNEAIEVEDGYVALGVTAADVTTFDENMWVWKVGTGGDMGDGCSLDADLRLRVLDTQLTRVPTDAAPTDTQATVTETNVQAHPVSLTPSYSCH